MGSEKTAMRTLEPYVAVSAVRYRGGTLNEGSEETVVVGSSAVATSFTLALYTGVTRRLLQVDCV